MLATVSKNSINNPILFLPKNVNAHKHVHCAPAARAFGVSGFALPVSNCSVSNCKRNCKLFTFPRYWMAPPPCQHTRMSTPYTRVNARIQLFTYPRYWMAPPPCQHTRMSTQYTWVNARIELVSSARACGARLRSIGLRPPR